MRCNQLVQRGVWMEQPTHHTLQQCCSVTRARAPGSKSGVTWNLTATLALQHRRTLGPRHQRHCPTDHFRLLCFFGVGRLEFPRLRLARRLRQPCLRLWILELTVTPVASGLGICVLRLLLRVGRPLGVGLTLQAGPPGWLVLGHPVVFRSPLGFG